jgi:hypothetical protein
MEFVSTPNANAGQNDRKSDGKFALFSSNLILIVLATKTAVASQFKYDGEV